MIEPEHTASLEPSASTAETLTTLEASGYSLVRPTPERFWQGWAELTNDAFDERFDRLDEVRGKDIVLGFLGRSHIGDVLCMSRLVRLLTTHYSCRVHVVRHRSTYKVLENHPHLAGYSNDHRVHLSECARGPGHMIQKLERYFGLPLDPFPRPEIHLSSEESHWAWQMRSMLPRNRPVALVCRGSITDNGIARADTLEWQNWVNILSNRFTVVHVALTDIARLEEAVRLRDSARAAWRPDQILDNCFVFENLTTRQFFAIFSVVDLYFGPNTGGAHLAAAFDVPAVVVLNSRQYRSMPAFPDRIEGNRWHHESFLYPYHSFLLG